MRRRRRKIWRCRGLWMEDFRLESHHLIMSNGDTLNPKHNASVHWTSSRFFTTSSSSVAEQFNRKTKDGFIDSNRSLFIGPIECTFKCIPCNLSLSLVSCLVPLLCNRLLHRWQTVVGNYCHFNKHCNWSATLNQSHLSTLQIHSTANRELHCTVVGGGHYKGTLRCRLISLLRSP